MPGFRLWVGQFEKMANQLITALGSAVRESTSKAYYFGRAECKFLLWQLRQQQPLIVHQMGRVGSFTIVQSLWASGVTRPIYHTHFLTASGIESFESLFKQGYGHWADIPPGQKSHLCQSRFLAKRLNNRAFSRSRYQVITLVRDPIAVNISHFFRNQPLWWRARMNSAHAPEHQGGNVDISGLQERFWQAYPHDWPLNWFDQEMKPIFGIDVFGCAFPKSRGYAIYHGERADVLLLKLEALDGCASQALREFLNLDRLSISKANQAANKSYHKIYRDFLTSIEIPDDYMDIMYTSKYARHFYTDEEITAFRAKWSRGARDVGTAEPLQRRIGGGRPVSVSLSTPVP